MSDEMSKEEAVEGEIEHLEEMREEMAGLLNNLSDGSLPSDPEVFMEEKVLEGETLTIEIDRGYFSLLCEAIEGEFIGQLVGPVEALLNASLFLEIVSQHQEARMEGIELKEECDCPECSGEGSEMPPGLQQMLAQDDAAERCQIDLGDDEDEAASRGFQ